MYKGVGVRFADFFLIFLIETKLFHFHKIFKNGEGEGGQANPLWLEPPLDPPLVYPNRSHIKIKPTAIGPQSADLSNVQFIFKNSVR